MDNELKKRIAKLEDDRDKKVARIAWHNEKLDKLRVSVNQTDSELDRLYEQHKRELRSSARSGDKGKP